MKTRIRCLALSAMALILFLCSSLTASAEQMKTFRFGYLEHPGSALCLLASAKGFFLKEGWQVTLVKYADSKAGLEDLASGRIDCGAFEIGRTLKQIAKGNPIQIIAGGGTLKSNSLLADIDDAAQAEQEQLEIVVVVPQDSRVLDKSSLIELVSTLIHAYQDFSKDPDRSWDMISGQAKRADGNVRVIFNPNPDYWRFEKQWQKLGLQQEKMPRDYLARHVYEEIYCDALDRILMENGLDDPVLQVLFSKAVCTPNCCPANSGKFY